MVVAAALAIAVAGAGSALAQSGLYCGNTIAVDSFYSTVASNGSKSAVTYYAQTRNMTGAPVLISVQFRPATQGSFANLINMRKTMTEHASERFVLGVQTLGNPSGNGKLDTGLIKAGFQLFCAAK
jgi:hypothetical protein